MLSWEHAGRPIAGATLILAAAYELTPLKNVCLGKCRSPLGTLLGSWRDGWSGALRMGAKNGAWCVGCCWALMASLFALGVMSVTWMAVVAGLIAVEKVLPWRRSATYGTALVLVALGALDARRTRRAARPHRSRGRHDARHDTDGLLTTTFRCRHVVRRDTMGPCRPEQHSSWWASSLR